MAAGPDDSPGVQMVEALIGSLLTPLGIVELRPVVKVGGVVSNTAAVDHTRATLACLCSIGNATRDEYQIDGKLDDDVYFAACAAAIFTEAARRCSLARDQLLYIQKEQKERRT
jgi:hypothetical protein